MYIFVSGGKTMGHISPLLGIILSLKEEYDFVYFGLKDSMEERVCTRYNIPFYSLELIPFNRRNILKNIKTFYLISKSKRTIKKEFNSYNPKCIITSGGFVSIPLVLSFKKTKKLLLESNTTLGLANKFLLRYVDYLGLQFDTFKNKKSVVIGNPLIIHNSTFDHPFFYLKDKPVLFVGGSVGAYEIVRCAFEFNIKYPNIKIIVITGDKYYEEFKFNSNARVYKRINELSGILNKFSLVVSRAGGSTITELINSSTPFVLYPSKNVSANHQELNAKYLHELGVCEIINDFNINSLVKIYNLLTDSIRQNIMIDKQNEIKILDSVNRIKKILF